MSRKPNARGTVLFLLCLAQLPALAGPPPDSTASRPNPRLGLVLGFDNRFSFVRESPVRIYGLNVGVKYHRSRFGLGGYTLRKDYRDHTYVSVRNRQDTVRPCLNLAFATPNFTYTFFNSRWVELCAPLEVGVGNSHFTLFNTRQEVIRERRGLFVPAAAGLGMLVKPTRWVGFSAAAGYRKSLLETDFKGDFDGWYYCYRVNVFLGNLLDDYRQQRERKRYKAAIPPSPEF
ncbi:MAG: hypothetical protein H7Z75_05350 [Ferruginibacter sp.]|nr:hypothetical protein [Cytophagales bacterium]